jgi:cytoskeletal protein CcmA (bactofilin family)
MDFTRSVCCTLVMALWNSKQDQPPPTDAGLIAGSMPGLPPSPREEASPPPQARREEPLAAAAGDLLLGPGAEFDGKLTFRGTLRIDARFKGSITTDGVLVVGENARIQAEVACGSVVVHGEVTGNVKATGTVELRRTARLRGDVTSPAIVVEKGALLQGSVRQAGEPVKGG